MLCNFIFRFNKILELENELAYALANTKVADLRV